MMAATPENKVKKAIRLQLLEWGLINAGIAKVPLSCKGWFYMPQNFGMGVSGIPDFVGCIGPMGRFFSIEAKAGDNQPTQQQKDRMAEIDLANGITCVAWGVDDIQFLKEFL